MFNLKEEKNRFCSNTLANLLSFLLLLPKMSKFLVLRTRTVPSRLRFAAVRSNQIQKKHLKIFWALQRNTSRQKQPA